MQLCAQSYVWHWSNGAEVYAIYEGFQGMVDGGERICKMDWNPVGGILQLGGTVIGSARSADFMAHEGRRTAAYNSIQHGIDGLIVIGGDGSLTGASVLRARMALTGIRTCR